MPIHDWTTVDDGLFHDFHGAWIQAIKQALNDGVLPPDYYALSEQRTAGVIPDVLTLEGGPPEEPPDGGGAGLLTARPKAHTVEETDAAVYRRKQRAVTVRRTRGDRVVAVVEIVSPGNKDRPASLRTFVEKAADLLDKGVHLLIADLHPPGTFDPAGIHAALWEWLGETPAARPADKLLTVAAYEAGIEVTAFVEPVAVGDALPDVPLFLVPGGHVLVPLEQTYQAAWRTVPRRWRRVIAPDEPG
jgi:hypothetical protein